MRPLAVVVALPFFDDLARLLERSEEMLIQAFVANRPMKLSAKPFCIGLPGAM